LSLARPFGRALAVIAAAGLVLRIAYVRWFSSHIQFGLDALWYELVAGTVAAGHGYVDPAHFYGHEQLVATAFRPPGYPFVLAAVAKVVDGSQRNFQYAGCLLGVATIVFIGLLARRLAGDTVGLLAAGLAAVYPAFLAIDASVMSESLYLPLVVVFLLLVYAALDRPSVSLWIAVGAVAGLCALTRGDALVLAPVVVVPALWSLRTRLPRRRVLFGLVALGAGIVVVAPWLIRNQRELGSPTIATLDAGSAVAGTNCPSTYGGTLLGSWDPACARTDVPNVSETDLTRDLERDGARYAAHHLGRAPLVVVARVARQWGAWNPVSEARLEAVESRNATWQLLTWAVYVPCACLCVYGLVLLRRRRVRIQPLVCVLIAVTVSAALTYGKQRLRVAAEPVILVGAAVALVDLASRFSRRRQPSAPQRSRDRSTSDPVTDDAPEPMLP
jgi:4-amino-4-deoxy-L-arabinose transferase-like glycosyltransferase